jgi:hypothetical protein
MQGAAVGKKNLDASALRTQSVAGKQRHVHRGRIRLAVTFENGRAVDKRDVSGRIGRKNLGVDDLGRLRERQDRSANP